MICRDMILRVMYNQCFVTNNMALYESYGLALYVLSSNFGALGVGPIFCFVFFFLNIYFVCFDSHICFRFCLNLTRLTIQQKKIVT